MSTPYTWIIDFLAREVNGEEDAKCIRVTAGSISDAIEEAKRQIRRAFPFSQIFIHNAGITDPEWYEDDGEVIFKDSILDPEDFKDIQWGIRYDAD